MGRQQAPGRAPRRAWRGGGPLPIFPRAGRPDPASLRMHRFMSVLLRRFGLLLLAGLLAAPALRAQAPDVELVEVDVDHAAFAYDGAQSLLEVYLAFGAATLPYEADPGGFRARLPLDLAVVRSTEATLDETPLDPVWQDSLTLSFVLADTAGLAQGQYFVHQTRLPVQPGEYELRVKVPADQARGRRELELRRDVLVPDFGQQDLVRLSDVTLASQIVRSDDRDDLFYKNGLVIRPNANQIYGEGLPDLFYYAEAYNTDQIADDAGRYTLLAYVAEANTPAPLPGLQRRTQRTARMPDVLAGTFDLSALPSGSYLLRLVLLDEHNEARAEQNRKFFVFNPSVARAIAPAVETDFESSPYATMSEEEVERGLEHIVYIASESERRRARRIQDLDERRRFLMEFWQKRDPQPATPINEFRDEFYGRIQYANERYSNNRVDGWETDRGRVLIKYGVPAQIEPHFYDQDAWPYEVWEFNNIPGEGQAVFIFYDPTGFGEFELLHSTVTGERKDTNWRQAVRR